MKRVIFLLAALFFLIVLWLTPTKAADDLRAERVIVESWNAYVQSVDAQNTLLLDLQADYQKHNPLQFAFADPALRDAQRRRRVTTWDAIIREQETQLALMRKARQAETEY